MTAHILIFLASLALVVHGATWAASSASRLAESFRLSAFTVGFLVIAVISILPETFIALQSAFAGMPSFGLGMLFGSNVADLTLVLAVLVLLAGRSIKVESRILKDHVIYPFILLVPLVLGSNGHFSRLEGLALVIIGGVFYYIALRNGRDDATPAHSRGDRFLSAIFLAASMAVLLVGVHFTVASATGLAYDWGVSPVLIGMLVVSLGTTMPELIFSLRSIRKQEDSLAVGDILGTVLADATIVVGLLALVAPFSFPPEIVFVTGTFMVLASCLLFYCMRTGRTLSRFEALLLLLYWVIFAFAEFIVLTR